MVVAVAGAVFVRKVLRKVGCWGAGRFIFLDTGGGPFGSAPFSEYLASLLQRHTGQRIAVNLYVARL